MRGVIKERRKFRRENVTEENEAQITQTLYKGNLENPEFYLIKRHNFISLT